MPIKSNITKYDVLVGEMHRLAQKCGSQHMHSGAEINASNVELSEEEQILKSMAVIIAAFSSNHSWKTYKCLQNNEQMDTAEVKDEYVQAESSRWKSISLVDVEELSNTQISDSNFYSWLFYNVEKDKQKVFREAWRILKKEFENSCDEIAQDKN